MAGPEINFQTNSKTQISVNSGTPNSAVELTQHIQLETCNSWQEETKRSSRLPGTNYDRNFVESPDEAGS
jgi:hypothetical protein